jgi:hypothetical protein
MRILSDGSPTLPLAEGPVGSVTDASTLGVAPVPGVVPLDIRPGWFHMARPGVAEQLIRPLLDDTGPVREPGLDIDRGFYLPVPPWELAVYRVAAEGRTQVGLVLEIALDDHLPGRIRPHEDRGATTLGVLDDRLACSGLDVAPVTLAHRPDREVSLALAEVTGHPAALVETSRDGAVHEVWLVEADRFAPVLDRLARTDSLDILDTHHRCAAAARRTGPGRDRPAPRGAGGEQARHRLFAFVVDHGLPDVQGYGPLARGVDPTSVAPRVPAGLFVRERVAWTA